MSHRLTSDFAEFIFEQVSTSGTVAGGTAPSADRDSGSIGQDGSSGDLVVLGGSKSSPFTTYTDLWTLNLGTGVWTQVSASYSSGSSTRRYLLGPGTGFIYETHEPNKASGAVTRYIDLSDGSLVSNSHTGSPATGATNYHTSNGSNKFLSVSLSFGVPAIVYADYVENAETPTTATLTRVAGSSKSVYDTGFPVVWDGTSLYLFARNTTSTATLSNMTVWKWTGADFTQETGITNNAGVVTISGATWSGCYWSAIGRIVFFKHGSNGEASVVLTYDPVNKIWSLPTVDGSSPTYIMQNQQSDAGGLCVRSDGIYFAKMDDDISSSTAVEIWKFKQR